MSDIKAARERLRTAITETIVGCPWEHPVYGRELPPNDGPSPKGKFDMDAYLIVKADIESHSGDDDEPYTTDWMVATYGDTNLRIGGEFWIQFYEGSPPDLECVAYEDSLLSVKLPECKTRGDVRRRLAELGIETPKQPSA